MRAINPADEIRPSKCRYRVKLGWMGVEGVRVVTGCKVRVCDNNFRLIMMRVMASRVSVAITLHVLAEMTVQPNK